MRVKKTILASAIALSLAAVGGPLWAKTTTIGGEFIIDRNTIEPGGKVNVSVLGLDINGQVDTQSQASGTTIIASVASQLGEVIGGGADQASAAEGYFAASKKYMTLQSGKGRAFVKYPSTATGTDTITVELWEKVDSGSGVQYNSISGAKTLTVEIKTPTAEEAKGLDIMAFYPADADPRGMMDCYLVKDECADKDDGIYGKMTAGTAGGKIVVWSTKNPYAKGTVTLTLKRPEATDVEHKYTAEMSQGSATITLDNKITQAGKYYVEAKIGSKSSVDMVYPDILHVWSTGIPKKVQLWATKQRISNPDFTTSFANSQVAQGTDVWGGLVDEYGNNTSDCFPTKNSSGMTVCTANRDFNVSIQDSSGVVSSTALNLYIPATSTDGKTMAKSGDSVLGNGSGELLKTGKASLIASVLDSSGNASTIVTDKSEALEIQVVDSSLAATVQSDFLIERLAGEEFSAFNVSLLNNKGQLHVNSSNTPLSPGEVVTKNLTSKEEFSTFPDSNNTTRALFKKQTGGDKRYLLSDKAGNYGQVLMEASAIVAAAAGKAELRNAHNQVVTDVTPLDISANKTYFTLLPELAFHLIDEFGNEKTGQQPLTAETTGQFTVSSSNGSVIYNTPETSLGVPGRWIQSYIDDPNNGYPSLATVMYDATGSNQFAGQDSISVNFTKPGVKSITVTSTIPSYKGVTKIMPYLQGETIPVNSEVAMTVDLLGEDGSLFIDPDPSASTNVTLTFNGQSGDTITPTVTEVIWNLKEGMTKDVCVSPMIWVEEQCFEMSTMSVSSGQTLDFAKTKGRKVLVINAGSADGQFSLVFTHTSVQGTEVKAVKTIKVGKIVPDCISDPTTCPTKAACEQTLSVFTDDGCELADARDPADTTQPTYPTNEDDAKFAAGTLNKTAKGTKFEASVTIGTHDIVQVASAIKVDKDDIGKKADILVAGLNLFPPGSTMVPPWSYFMLRGCGPVEITNNTCPSVGWVVELWPQNSDGQVSIAGLKPFQSVDALQEYQTLYVYTGNLDLPIGTELWLYYGYMITQAGIDQGKLVFNKVPMEITIK